MMRVNYIKLILALINRKTPIYAHFGLTHRCNLQCRMCNIWKTGHVDAELNLAQINNLANTLNSLGVFFISLGGGEPLLRGDLNEIIAVFIQKGLRVRLLTNGLLMEERGIQDMIRSGLRDISVSLDTALPQRQSYICQQEGIWEKIVDRMTLLSRLFPKRGSLLLVNTTVSRLNLEELPSLARFVAKLGYYISFVPLERRESGHCGVNIDGYPAELKITTGDYKTVDKIYEELIRMKQKNNSNIFNSTRFLNNSRQFLKNADRNWQCDAGRLYFSLTPQGGFSLCHRFNPERQYSDYDIITYLKSKEFNDKQKMLTKGCAGCMRPCWAEITNLAKDPRSFWEMLKVQVSASGRRRF